MLNKMNLFKQIETCPTHVHHFMVAAWISVHQGWKSKAHPTHAPPTNEKENREYYGMEIDYKDMG
ncbi:hypothetical protein AXF42_Ash001363 [Apostasia shenzhenica]|uniref:Uncharacterized protein n=1 Tax=Apostasia shenzhenica TaxID=1088818 RepID=A0A2I0AUP3_9ASPA|nr:hypothetical protein AXF42_Ash001363 [Apostasia shenzhenica]